MKRICFMLVFPLLVNSAFADIFSDVSGGWYRSVKGQLDAGVPVNSVDCFANTLLHKAAEAGQLQVAELLVEHGALIDCLNILGKSPLGVAVKASQYDMAKWLLEQGAIQEELSLTENLSPLLHQVVVKGDEAFVRLLVQYKADLNAKDLDGNTALFLAIRNGFFAIAEFLIRAGADVNEKNNLGLTPLMMAASVGWQSIVDLLLDRGAEVDTVGNNGVNALFMAVYSNHADIVKILLAHGADIDHRFGDDQFTILHIATFLGREAIVLELLKADVFVDSVCKGGRTPLLLAAIWRNIGIAKILLRYGADMFIADEKAKTPYDKVLESQIQPLINLFENYKKKKRPQIKS